MAEINNQTFKDFKHLQHTQSKVVRAESDRELLAMQTVYKYLLYIYRGTVEGLTLTEAQKASLKQKALTAYNSISASDFKAKALEIYQELQK